MHLGRCNANNNTRLTIWLQSRFQAALFSKSATIGLGRTDLGTAAGSPARSAMATTHKKVIVRKMDRDSVNGYVGAAFISDGKLELMNTAGNVVAIELREVKGVYFVREFGDSESLTRKTFTSRPRVEGLWVRLRFRDNEVIEGMMPNDLLHEGSDGFFHHSSRHALQHPADFCAARGSGGDDGHWRDRRQESGPPRPASGGHAPGADVHVTS